MKERQLRIEEGVRSALLAIPHNSDVSQPLLDELRATFPDSPVFDLVGWYPEGAQVKRHDGGYYTHNAFYGHGSDIVGAERQRCLASDPRSTLWQYFLPYGIPLILRYSVSGKLEEAFTKGDGFTGLDATNVVRRIDGFPTSVRLPKLMEDIGVPFELELHCVAVQEGGILEEFYSLLLGRNREITGQTKLFCHAILVDGQPVIDLETLMSISFKSGSKCFHGTNETSIEFIQPFECRPENQEVIGKIIEIKKQDWQEGKGCLTRLVTRDAVSPQLMWEAHYFCERATAQLYGAEWVTLNNQDIIPILLISPAHFFKETVTQVLSTGYGYGEKSLNKGDTLTLEKFPYMQPTLVSFSMEDGSEACPLPSSCPACRAQPIRSTKAGMRCINQRCTSTLLQRARRYLNKIRIVSLTDVQLRRLIDVGKIADVTDLYCLSADDFSELFGGNQESGREMVANLLSMTPSSAVELFAAVIGDNYKDSLVVSFSSLLEESGPDAPEEKCLEHFKMSGITDVSSAYEKWKDSAVVVSELLSLTKHGV